MKTYVTFENGYQEVENMEEAIIVANENPTTNYIVEIDEESLPEDVSVEIAFIKSGTIRMAINCKTSV